MVTWLPFIIHHDGWDGQPQRQRRQRRLLGRWRHQQYGDDAFFGQDGATVAGR